MGELTSDLVSGRVLSLNDLRWNQSNPRVLPTVKWKLLWVQTTFVTDSTSALFFVPGTRYRRRGVDDNGDVANFVETEQVWELYAYRPVTLSNCVDYIALSNVYFLAVHSLRMLLFFFLFFSWRSVFVLQIICTSTHNVSFAQVRGSVPVYWSQPGYKYRPPPRLDRGTQEKLMVLNRKDTRDGHVHA